MPKAAVILLSIYLLLVAGAWAQAPIRLQSHAFSLDKITVGTPFLLQLIVEVDKGVDFSPTVIDISSLPHVEAEAPKVEKFKPKNGLAGKAYHKVVYPLRAFAPGSHTLPPIEIGYTLDGQQSVFETGSFTFEVTPVKPANSSEMKDIAPPVVPASNWPLYALAFTALAVASGLILWYAMRRKRLAVPLPEVAPQQSPHDIALAKLRQIEAANLVAQEQFKRYHTEVSHVVREYISMQYDIPALELTTEELLHRLSSENVGEENHATLRRFFTACDLVKFAGHRPNKPTAHERMNEAKRFIEATKRLRSEKDMEGVTGSEGARERGSG